MSSSGGGVRVRLAGRDDGVARPAIVVEGPSPAARLIPVDDEHRVLLLDGTDGHGAPGSDKTAILLLPLEPGLHGSRGISRREVVVNGWRLEVELEPAARAALRERAVRDRPDAGHSGPTEVRAMIPGVVVSTAVATGDQVLAGQQLLVVEAMKMQNELRAPRGGTVARFLVGAGSTIDLGELLLVIE